MARPGGSLLCTGRTGRLSLEQAEMAKHRQVVLGKRLFQELQTDPSLFQSLDEFQGLGRIEALITVCNEQCLRRRAMHSENEMSPALAKS